MSLRTADRSTSTSPGRQAAVLTPSLPSLQLPVSPPPLRPPRSRSKMTTHPPWHPTQSHHHQPALQRIHQPKQQPPPTEMPRQTMTNQPIPPPRYRRTSRRHHPPPDRDFLQRHSALMREKSLALKRTLAKQQLKKVTFA